MQFYQFKRFENDEIKIAEAWYAIVPVGETIESRWPDCSIQRINFFDENKIDSNKSSLKIKHIDFLRNLSIGPWGPIVPWGPGLLGTHGPLGPQFHNCVVVCSSERIT